MKYLLPILLLVTINASAQKTGIFNYTNDKIFFSEVIATDTGKSKEQLMLQAKQLVDNLVLAYNKRVESDNDRMKDYVYFNDGSTIKANVGFLVEQFLTFAPFSAKLAIEVENGKYKYTLEDFNKILPPSQTDVNPTLEASDVMKQKVFMAKADAAIKEIITSIKDGMK